VHRLQAETACTEPRRDAGIWMAALLANALRPSWVRTFTSEVLNADFTAAALPVACTSMRFAETWTLLNPAPFR